MRLKTNYLEKLTQNKLIDLAEFVVKENFKHHSNNVLPENYMDDVESIYREEKKFHNLSSVFVVKDTVGEILGAIRVLKWNYVDKLPIEKIFGINPISVTGNAPLKPIWHIGRFAIRQEVRDITLFKKLMVCAIAPVCASKNGVAFAEIDSKLLRVLKLIGIQATVVGESIEYLGSETIPVCFTYDGLINFFNKNKDLLPNHLKPTTYSNTQNLPKSVVFNKSAYDYPLV
jgi:hypothetical protein